LGVELSHRDDVQATYVFGSDKPLVMAVRVDAPDLLAKVNRFVATDCKGLWFRKLQAKYFAAKPKMQRARADALGHSGQISPYDGLARTYGRRYGIDWRFIVAQMYQESRFDPRAQSWVGAVGLLQVMPRTGAEMGFRNLWHPDTNVHAGVKYLSRLLSRFEAGVPMRQRIRFALAAYNAGLGHVLDARRLARTQGLDPNRWFGHVEEAMVLLEKPRYYRRARHGYVRGNEPVTYVSRIQSKYDAYARLMPVAEL
jgi:membrane-bound lytic murein transglycosylase F